MLSNSHNFVRPASECERAYLESLIRVDYEHCHPGETLEDMKLRASFSKEDGGLLRDWMAVAAIRAAAERAAPSRSITGARRGMPPSAQDLSPAPVNPT